MLDWLDLAVRAAPVLVGWAVIGVALDGLARSTIVGVAGPLVVAFLVETMIVQSLQSETLALALPIYNAGQAISADASTAVGYDHLAVFGVWALLSLGASLGIVGRRDA